VPISPRFISDDMKTLKRAQSRPRDRSPAPLCLSRRGTDRNARRSVQLEAEENSDADRLMPNREACPSSAPFTSTAAELPNRNV